METKSNLLRAMTGESIARNKYTFFAKIAAKEGLIWISKVFEETADQERAHAEEELEQIDKLTEMTNAYDIHPLSTTLENLRNAAAGEKYEFEVMYPTFEAKAKEEADEAAATLFHEIAEVEEKHYERYVKLADRLEAGNLLSGQTQETEWKCLNCGYIHKGGEAPHVCPVCKKPQGWYMQIGFIR